MKIFFSTKAIKPMYDWLYKSKAKNIRNENELRKILKMKAYSIEFSRYGEPNLPLCNISFEEAVDFFMNFDKKDFTNQRLQIKKNSFNEFYNNLEEKSDEINLYSSLSEEDKSNIIELLENGLPANTFDSDSEFTILLTISIGNSMGWPYGDYIHFDVANFGFIDSKETFIHTIAHELHHTCFSNLLTEDMNSKGFFFVNFAFEGLAVHFNNNAETLYKEKKYPNDKTYLIDEKTWTFFEENFDEFLNRIKEDAKKSESLSFEETKELLSKDFEQPICKTKSGKEMLVLHYATYYFGCYMWGIIDLAFGKDKLFETLAKPNNFVEVYNEAIKKVGNKDYLLE